MGTAETGDEVFLVEDVIDTDGVLATPHDTGRWTVVGFVGLYTAVLQTGMPGDYRYAHAPLSSFRRYERRPRGNVR